MSRGGDFCKKIAAAPFVHLWVTKFFCTKDSLADLRFEFIVIII